MLDDTAITQPRAGTGGWAGAMKLDGLGCGRLHSEGPGGRPPRLLPCQRHQQPRSVKRLEVVQQRRSPAARGRHLPMYCFCTWAR